MFWPTQQVHIKVTTCQSHSITYRAWMCWRDVIVPSSVWFLFSTFWPTSRDTNWTCMVGQLKLQYFGAGCWVGRSPNLFFNRNRWREYLSSGEKRAAPQGNISVNHYARSMGTQIIKQSKTTNATIKKNELHMLQFCRFIFIWSYTFTIQVFTSGKLR
jgi:hypothetical protein